MRAPTPLRLARWLLDGTLVSLVGIVLGAVVLARVLPALDHETVTITGRSMEPTIPLGSVIVLDRVTPAQIAAGDVVTVTIPERLITYTHRVVDVIDRDDGRWLRTKGDFNDAADPVLVPVAWVVGRMDVALPALGWLLRLLALPSGVLTLLGLAFTLFLSARLLEELEWDAEDELRQGARPIAAQVAARASARVVPMPELAARPRRRTATDSAARAEIRARTEARTQARGRTANRAARS